MTDLKTTIMSLMLAIVVAAPAVPAQEATLRMGFGDGVFPGAMRPDTFVIGRKAVVPWSEGGRATTVELGELLTRRGSHPGEAGRKIDIHGNLRDRASTTMTASAEPGVLHLEIRCSEPFTGEMKDELDTYFPDDRIDVFLDMNHDHYTFTRISVMPDGRTEQAGYAVRENHLCWDQGHRRMESDLDFTATTGIDGNGWTLELDVTLSDAGDRETSDAWRVIGMNVVRYRSVGGEEVTMWCPDYNHVAAPLYFGDLYLGEPPAVVSQVTLGTVCRGANEGTLVFAETVRECEIEAVTHNHAGRYSSGRFRSGGAACRFSWDFDPRDLLFASLRLRVDGGYWGGYEFGWRRGLLMTLAPGPGGDGALAEKPSPGEEEYSWKYSRYILDRLPRLERTEDGLGLRSDAGLFIDLRDGGAALDRLARIVTDTFETDEERIVGAALLLCQEGLMVSSGMGERLSQRFGGPGILRIGAAFCSAYAELLRDVAARMTDSSGKRFNACVVNFKRGPADTMGWPNHWVAGVAYNGGLTLIDAELGMFFIHPENGRLVTLEELLEQPALADRSVHGFSEYFEDRPLGDFHVREYGDLWNEWY